MQVQALRVQVLRAPVPRRDSRSARLWRRRRVAARACGAGAVLSPPRAAAGTPPRAASTCLPVASSSRSACSSRPTGSQRTGGCAPRPDRDRQVRRRESYVRENACRRRHLGRRPGVAGWGCVRSSRRTDSPSPRRNQRRVRCCRSPRYRPPRARFRCRARDRRSPTPLRRRRRQESGRLVQSHSRL
ncbi:Uncharacterised protein [Mycobacteroides abscessus subsp. abscessus]|nr:Uncharacterised protein [Mycobacteroides abscessus subsp. abscessus]